MQKKAILVAVASLAVVGTAGVLFSTKVFAADTTNPSDTFISKLASKLGISESQVQTAVDETRTEMRSERQAEVQTEVQTALENGDLTQRQVDIINAMEEIRSENVPDSSSTRESSTDTNGRYGMGPGMMDDTNMIDQLNEKGLNVTSDELQSLRQTMRDLGIGMEGFGGGHGHMGGMMGF